MGEGTHRKDILIGEVGVHYFPIAVGVPLTGHLTTGPMGNWIGTRNARNYETHKRPIKRHRSQSTHTHTHNESVGKKKRRENVYEKRNEEEEDEEKGGVRGGGEGGGGGEKKKKKKKKKKKARDGVSSK